MAPSMVLKVIFANMACWPGPTGLVSMRGHMSVTPSFSTPLSPYFLLAVIGRSELEGGGGGGGGGFGKAGIGVFETRGDEPDVVVAYDPDPYSQGQS